MINTHFFYRTVKYTILFGCVIVILTHVSCHKKSYKQIPEKKMVAILTDYYIINGLAMNYSMSKELTNLDSAVIYGSVLTKKYGYHKEDFDSTLAYYITQPDKIQSVFQQVIDELIKRENIIKELEREALTKTTLWVDDTIHRYPEDTLNRKLAFSVPVKEPGMYTLKTTIILFKDDESVNPHVTVFFWYDNKSTLGNRQYFPPVTLKKNGRRENYTVSARLANRKFTHIKGYMLDEDNKNTDFKKHAKVEKITIELEK